MFGVGVGVGVGVGPNPNPNPKLIIINLVIKILFKMLIIFKTFYKI